MIQSAWEYLQAHGVLTNRFLLSTDGLNVKRSSFVCALLARLPGVSVARRGRSRWRFGQGRRPCHAARVRRSAAGPAGPVRRRAMGWQRACEATSSGHAVGTRAMELDRPGGTGPWWAASSGHDVERSGEPIAAGRREDASLLPERIAVVER